MPRDISTPPLTLDAVLEAGRTIVAVDGFEALTMRRIADQLGVWPTAVYHYVEDRERLAGLVTDVIVGQLNLPTDENPIAWLRETAWRMRTVALAHPGLAAYLLDNGAAGPNGLHLVEAAATHIASLGYHGHDLAQAYNWFFTWLAGTVHKSDRFQVRGPAGVLQFVASLEASDSPEVAAIRQSFASMPDDPDAVFAWGLNRMLAALAQPEAGTKTPG